MRIPYRKFIGIGLFGLLVALFLLDASLGFAGLRAAYKQMIHWSKQTSAIIDSYNFSKHPGPQPVRTTIASDGMLLVYIPSGKFIMGTDDPSVVKSNPSHQVYLDAYWIDQTEVTNAMYQRCVAAGACGTNDLNGQNPYTDPELPAVYVTWFDAQAYCKWAGRRLPTEAEWEKAARGIDGRTYPWGETVPDSSLANFGGQVDLPLPANRYLSASSPFGVLNMAGNVREWVNDWFNQVYYQNSPEFNPTGPKIGTERSLRGGSFLDDGRELRIFNRFEHDPASPGVNRGFRCAQNDIP